MAATAFVDSEVFTALSHVQRLVNIEMELSDALDDYITEQESRLNRLKDFADAVNDAMVQAKSNRISYIGHPVNTYLMIKRLVKDWPTHVKSVEQEGDAEGIYRIIVFYSQIILNFYLRTNSGSSVPNNKWHQKRVLFGSFHWDGHTVGIQSQTQTFYLKGINVLMRQTRMQLSLFYASDKNLSELWAPRKVNCEVTHTDNHQQFLSLREDFLLGKILLYCDSWIFQKEGNYVRKCC